MREKPNRFRRKMSRALTKARLGALYKDVAEYECDLALRKHAARLFMVAVCTRVIGARLSAVYS